MIHKTKKPENRLLLWKLFNNHFADGFAVFIILFKHAGQLVIVAERADVFEQFHQKCDQLIKNSNKFIHGSSSYASFWLLELVKDGLHFINDGVDVAVVFAEVSDIFVNQPQIENLCNKFHDAVEENFHFTEIHNYSS